MAVEIGGEGLLFNPTNLFLPIGYSATQLVTLDATGEIFSSIGRFQISDKGSSKSLAGATMWFRNSGGIFSDAGSTFRIGIQDVDLTTGFADGVFDIYKDFIGSSGELLNNTWQGYVLDQGSKSVSHGDLIAISFEFVTKAGSDQVNIQYLNNSNGFPPRGFPYGQFNVGTPTKNTSLGPPIALIVFADGEIGRIDNTWCWTDPDQGVVNTTTQSGLYFVAPFTGTVNKLIFAPIDSLATTDVLVLSIWDDPLGSPNIIYQETLDSDVYATTSSSRFSTFMLPTPVSVTLGNEYVISLHTTNGLVNYGYVNLGTGNSGMRKITAIGENWCRASRTLPSSGAFTLTDTHLPSIGFYMNSIDIGGAGGGETAYTFG